MQNPRLSLQRRKSPRGQSTTRRNGPAGRLLRCEPLEQRHLLSVTINPISGPDAGGVFDVPSGRNLFVPVTGSDTGQTINYTATSSDPNVQVSVLSGNPTIEIG